MRICTVLTQLAVVILTASAFGQSPALHQFLVSLPDIKLRPHDRIVRFQCDIRSAIVEQITNLPNGWTFEITNDNSDMAKIRAQSIVGAASFTDGSYFKKFMIIQMDYPPSYSEAPPFTIDFRIAITTDPDDTATRELDFSTREVLLTPADAGRK